MSEACGQSLILCIKSIKDDASKFMKFAYILIKFKFTIFIIKQCTKF